MNTEKMLEECRAHWEKTKPDSVFADYWLGWKDSRESLVIELPEERKAYGYGEKVADALGFNDGLNECREAIEAAGLKVTP